MQNTTKIGIFFWIFVCTIGVGKVNAGCSVSASTLYPTPYSNNQITLNVANTGTSLINWINIPVGFTSSWMNVTLDILSSGWEQGLGGSGLVFSGGNLSPGDSVAISTTGNTGAQGETIYWGLSTSANVDGSEAEACNTIELNITSTPPLPTPAPTPVPTPTISDATLTVSNSSAILSWNTNLQSVGAVY